MRNEILTLLRSLNKTMIIPKEPNATARSQFILELTSDYYLLANEHTLLEQFYPESTVFSE